MPGLVASSSPETGANADDSKTRIGLFSMASKISHEVRDCLHTDNGRRGPARVGGLPFVVNTTDRDRLVLGRHQCRLSGLHVRQDECNAATTVARGHPPSLIGHFLARRTYWLVNYSL
jgi:hypothetical protein